MKRSETHRPEARKTPHRPRSGRAAAEAATLPPTIRTLNRAECESILARNHVGRLAFSFHDRVDIEPLHYVYDNGWLVGRTSYGAKLGTLRHRPWVAFEVDEIEGIFDWRSVVIHGVFDIVTADGPPREAQAWERAIESLRTLVPATAAPGDPVPFRTVIFRIKIDEVTGREARTG
jgi:nitroimidazol reductase NimA-like FMN-containing flavoprotein (pyridoxamine 5'-phosphate oxidase superfamily)